MTLGQLIGDQVALDPALASLPVAGVQEDSRRVAPGDLFVAVSGLTVDGHDYAPQAAAAGAVAVVAARPLALDVPCVVVPDPPRVLALAAARLAGDPARRLRLLGVTGTNGKTTTCYLMESILAAAGQHPGVVGTVEYRYAGRTEKAPFTTPTPLVLHPVLRRMVDAGCTHGVLEVSSHALELGRTWGLDFSVAAFSNLTQDHLDLHGSMERYLQAKLLLFSRHLAAGGTAVVNVDGQSADAVLEAVRRRGGELTLLRCSTAGRPAEASLLEARHSIDGLRARLLVRGRQQPISSPLLGAFNGDNILLAAACCHAVGVDLPAVARGVARLTGVPGRLERVDHGREFAVLVDYAHTPDALRRAMEVLRPLCRGRLIVVFGCGGDRDRAKRPLMGGAVARAADLSVVTSDNPRTEDPLAIIASILEGVQAEGTPRLTSLDADRGHLVQPDRRRAIFAAVAAARDGDVVLIAGKGHEDYQILGTERIHFDDREQAREALAGGAPA
jgi:UDP-N-acetylmuramyl-tripeptide synthetase